MLRLFAAIAIPDDIAEPLEGRLHDLEGARWRPIEALHITLRFFGELTETVADDLDAELSTITSPPFALNLQEVGSFGEGYRLDTLWAGVSDSEPLRQLAHRCETAARRAGLKPEGRVYKPHVTLAYLKRPAPAAVAAWIQANNLLKSPPFGVDRFGLYSSHQTGEGSRYRLEKEYRF
ncbi:2'-5' RNA ligase [Caulobacter ginsengisoli]|uniref:RNA 2',3'-cyclic phosphodiesterase n=1 Tax=Caulobacter ginsengisoli TaxID=400775 RepID=A0ABU0IYZ2_9CAUL|nr:RNA 2',3'-cyclic phosphodiesterase [Caulobacter ginsengisoli]MDQ0466187.1 2'-5' RNA ligase [Caulobacter ginsengisoli]